MQHCQKQKPLLGILGLIDKTMLGNLLILVIFSGYENFVSMIGIAQGSPDRPRWMGDVDFAGLKLKLIGSIVALSGINLLGAFLNLKNWSPQDLGWMVGIHLTFVVTGVLFALSEKIGHKKTNKTCARAGLLRPQGFLTKNPRQP